MRGGSFVIAVLAGFMLFSGCGDESAHGDAILIQPRALQAVFRVRRTNARMNVKWHSAVTATPAMEACFQLATTRVAASAP